MDKILVLGAGKSSGVLIKYLAEQSARDHFQVTVADSSENNLRDRVARFSNIEQVCGIVEDRTFLLNLIASSTVVVSLLPPTMHLLVAHLCIECKKNLLTASYVSPEMKALEAEVKSKDLTFLNECGLDPGLDHMSAMQLLHKLKDQGAEIKTFRSFCGGLIAPESNDNPWGYKITWNPRNVVLAGQGTAQYLENKRLKFVPYHQVFKRISPVYFDQYGEYEAYPNRDSISYIQKYELAGIENFIRGTIRTKGFCSAWDKIVQLGLTDDAVKISESQKLSIAQFFQLFHSDSFSLMEYLGLNEQSEDWQKLRWLGFESNELLLIKNNSTPAEYLQKLLEDKWRLGETDKDLVVMQHQIEYELDNKRQQIISSLALEGENSLETAMAKTVGLPLAIATKMVLQSKIRLKGVIIPTVKEIYNPILKELQNHKIIFRENA